MQERLHLAPLLDYIHFRYIFQIPHNLANNVREKNPGLFEISPTCSSNNHLLTWFYLNLQIQLSVTKRRLRRERNLFLILTKTTGKQNPQVKKKAKWKTWNESLVPSYISCKTKLKRLSTKTSHHLRPLALPKMKTQLHRNNKTPVQMANFIWRFPKLI